MKKLTESLEVNGPKAFRPCPGDGTPVRPFNPFRKTRQGEETPVQFKAAQNAICNVKQPFIQMTENLAAPTQMSDKRLKKLDAKIETKSKELQENKTPEVVFNPDGSLRIKRRRNRKCPKQMEYLLGELQKDPDWTKETCQRVSLETGLSVV